MYELFALYFIQNDNLSLNPLSVVSIHHSQKGGILILLIKAIVAFVI